MIQLGKYAELEVLRQVEQGLYLDGGPYGDILLPTRYIPEGAEVGEDIRVFLYCDSADRPIATTETPLAQVGEFAYLQVKEVNDYGAFLDWGLAKDLFVPFREQQQPMKAGTSCVVYIYVDENTDRLVASSRLGRFLKKQNRDLEKGQQVEILVAEAVENGFQVIVDNRYWGRLYQNEIFREVKIGDRLPAYVKNIREDQLIDISLQEQGYGEISKTARFILEKLKTSGGFLPLTDKSSPESIYSRLQMSKKVFKKSIGALYKQRLILLEKQGIRLAKNDLEIRDARPEEFAALGQLMVEVYSQLEGFPDPEEQPDYYQMLARIGDFTKKPETKLLVAISPEKQLLGGVVYFGDMQYYGSGGAAPRVTDASGIRLLAVDPKARGKGVGKALTRACIQLAKDKGQSQVVLHTTKAMQTAWGMYERMGFERSPDLDFLQEELPVFGFRLSI